MGACCSATDVPAKNKSQRIDDPTHIEIQKMLEELQRKNGVPTTETQRESPSTPTSQKPIDMIRSSSISAIKKMRKKSAGWNSLHGKYEDEEEKEREEAKKKRVEEARKKRSGVSGMK